jgi:hypothetical protein
LSMNSSIWEVVLEVVGRLPPWMERLAPWMERLVGRLGVERLGPLALGVERLVGPLALGVVG